jgi:hypothetical protein
MVHVRLQTPTGTDSFRRALDESHGELELITTRVLMVSELRRPQLLLKLRGTSRMRLDGTCIRWVN